MIGDSTPDTVVDALRVLFANRIDLALSSTWGQDAVATTIPHPVVRSALAAETLPLLSVVRRGSNFTFQGTRKVVTSPIVAEWYAPQCTIDRLAEFWRALAPVGVEMIRALDGYTYTDENDTVGTEVLQAVGVQEIPEDSIRFVSNYVQLPDGGVFPFVSLTFDCVHTLDCLPLHEWDGLHTFDDLLARWCLTKLGAVDAADQPLLSTLTAP